VTQCISNEVEVVQADEDVCIAMTESQVDIQGGKIKCLTGRDLWVMTMLASARTGLSR
jgi:hypothetical protein